MFQAFLSLPDTCEQEYSKSGTSRLHHDTDNDYAKFRKYSAQVDEYYNSPVFTKSFLLSFVEENKQEPQQDFLLTSRDYSREFPTNIDDEDSAPNFTALRALTNAAHYNSCWAFSSMPEIPVMQSDDEFLVDTGIRIPTQFSTSQSASKIPHLQDFISSRRQTNNAVRPRRSSLNSFDKSKFKRHSSVEYEDCMKRRTSENEPSRNSPTSIDYEEGLQRRHMTKENLSDQLRIKRYSAPHVRGRFGFDFNQDRSIDEKLKRSSLILEKDKLKITNSRCTLDRTKRHSVTSTFNLKLPDTKETKQIAKRHSLEDQTTARRARERGYFSTLDVNHNQGFSKIPLRNIGLRSRTAPATRASSPVHTDLRLRFDIENSDSQGGSTSDRQLSRFSSSDEEVDKLCKMLLHSQTVHSSAGETTRNSRDEYPIRLLIKKL